MEPVDPSKLQVVVRKVLASSNVYYLILMWLIRVVVFVLWIGKGILIWVLTFAFSLIRECTQKYLSVALVGFALTPQQRAPQVTTSSIEDTKRTGGESKEFDEAPATEEEEEEDDGTTATMSPLLPIVLRDRLQIWEENLALEDRYV